MRREHAGVGAGAGAELLHWWRPARRSSSTSLGLPRSQLAQRRRSAAYASTPRAPSSSASAWRGPDAGDRSRRRPSSLPPERSQPRPVSATSEQERANLHVRPRNVAPPPLVRTTISNVRAPKRFRAQPNARAPRSPRREQAQEPQHPNRPRWPTERDRAASPLSAPGGSVRTVLPRKSEPKLKTARSVLTARARVGRPRLVEHRLGPGPQPTSETAAPTDRIEFRRRDGQPPDGDVRRGVQPDPDGRGPPGSGSERQGRLHRRQERPAHRRERRGRQHRHHLARLAHRRQHRRDGRHRQAAARERVRDSVPRGREGQHPHPARRQPGHPGRDLRLEVEPRPGAPARAEGERRAQPHLRGAAEARCRSPAATRRSPRSPTRTSTTCSTTEESGR